MAKRYGRNQKRAAREQIAQLEQDRKRDRSLVSHQRDQLDEFESWSERLNYAVPMYSALRKDVAVIAQQHDPGDTQYTSTMPKLDLVRGVSDPVPEYMSTIERIRMNVVRVEAQRDQFNHGLRFELRVGGGKRVMYAIDDAMIDNKDYDENFERYVAREITKGMILHLKNA